MGIVVGGDASWMGGCVSIKTKSGAGETIFDGNGSSRFNLDKEWSRTERRR